MTTSEALAPAPSSTLAGPTFAAPTFWRLLNTEFRRLTARRFTRVLLCLSILGFAVAVGYLWHGHSQTTPADLAQATIARNQNISDIKQQIAECLKQGSSADTCGTVPTTDDMPVDMYLQNSPFNPFQVGDYALAVGAAVAMAGFLIGATSIGAEWSSKNIVAWLFYEPRRLRLIGAKVLALTSVLLVLSILAQALWWMTAHLLIHYRGDAVSTLGPQAAQFWPDVLHAQVRAVLLVIPTGLLGFALANLIKNSAAALGVAFVYFAVLESLVRSLNPNLQPYLFTTGVAAWVQKGGIDIFGKVAYNIKNADMEPQLIHVSNLQGGVVMAIYAAVALTVSVILFRRRDIA